MVRRLTEHMGNMLIFKRVIPKCVNILSNAEKQTLVKRRIPLKTNNYDEMKNEITLKEAQEQVDQWIKTIGVRYFSELTNMAVLTEEVGELARIMARTYGDQSFKKTDPETNLADEMADVLWVLICLANQTGVDLTVAFRENLEKKTKRDAARHVNNEKLK
jgi:NTP pyrophosphatase (non-canonical NTP hydrolase)